MSKEKKKKGPLWSLMWILIGLTVAYLVMAVVLYYASDSWENRGTFGDMFGAANAFFSVLALGAVIYTTYLQREDLNLQRKIQETQLEELKSQAKSTEKSAQQLQEQQELSFFQLTQETVMNFMRMKKDILESIQMEYLLSDSSQPEAVRLGVALKTTYYKKEEDNLVEAYLRIFTYTLKYIHESDINYKQKELLALILNAETSDEELEVIYNKYHNNQYQLGLLAKYGFLDRIKVATV